MGQYGAMVADAGSVSQRYANRLVAGIPEDRFARLAAIAGQTIQSNHPAFALGHLCLYPAKVLELLGRPGAAGVQPPSNYEALFSKTASCQDDPTASIYPSAAEIIDFFNSSYRVAFDALRAADDAAFAAENPVDTPIREICPTLGSMLTFYVTGHVATHLGQISAWRRMQGLPPA